MKKLFTLMAAALFAANVFASEVDILDKFTYTWNSNETIVNNPDGSKTFNAVEWGGMAAWLENDGVKADWSGYEKVVFEYAEATTVNTQILVGDASAWGEVGITKLECSFDGKDMSALSQIALQASAATSITITRVYLVSAEEGGEEAGGATYMFGGIAADMITIDANGEKSTTTLDEVTIPSVNYTGTGDYMNVSFSNMENVKLAYKNGSNKSNIFKFAEKFTQVDGKNGVIIISGLKADDVVSLFVSAKGSTASKFEALKGCTADAGNPGEVTKAASVDEYVEVKFTATDSEIQIKETSGGFRISKLLVNGGATGIQETVAPVKVINNGAIYNLAGQKVNENYKGIVIKNGKKYIQK